MDMKIRLSLFVVTIFVFCQSCVDGKSNANEVVSATAVSVMDTDSVTIFIEDEDEVAVAGQKVAVRTYLITDSCAGPFVIGSRIPDNVNGFTVTVSGEEKTLETGEIREIPVYIYELGNEGWVKLTPQYDMATGCVRDRTGEIFVYSDLFLTDRGIGAMSSIEEYAAAYPDFHIGYARESELFVVETPCLKNVQFIIDSEYYQGGDTLLLSSESVELQVSDFRKETCFTAIRIINNSTFAS